MNKSIKWLGSCFVVALATLWLLAAAAPPKYTTFADLVWTNTTTNVVIKDYTKQILIGTNSVGGFSPLNAKIFNFGAAQNGAPYWYMNLFPDGVDDDGNTALAIDFNDGGFDGSAVMLLQQEQGTSPATSISTHYVNSALMAKCIGPTVSVSATGVVVAVYGSSAGISSYGVGTLGRATGTSTTNAGAIGWASGGTNVGVAGFIGAITGNPVIRKGAAGYFDMLSSGMSPLLCYSNATVLFEVAPTLTTNTFVFHSAGGVASYSTIATNPITATGVTNTSGVDRQAIVTATAVSFTVNDRSGAVLYTSPTLTATLCIKLQPLWSIRAASGLVGTVIP